MIPPPLNFQVLSPRSKYKGQYSQRLSLKNLGLYVTLIQTIYKVLFTYSLSVWQYGYVILLQTIFKAVFTSNNSELQYDYVTLLQSIFKLHFTRNKSVLQYDYVSLLQTSFQTSP